MSQNLKKLEQAIHQLETQTKNLNLIIENEIRRKEGLFNINMLYFNLKNIVDWIIHYNRRYSLSLNIELIRKSDLFDFEFYSKNYKEVLFYKKKHIYHYLLEGYKKNYNPHPLFDSEYYLDVNKDVKLAAVPPFLHFIKDGFHENRNPHPLFDCKYYLQNNADVAEAGVNPLLHFWVFGWKEGRNPHPLFDVSFYLKKNSDVAGAGVNPLSHFCEFGWKEERNPHPLFDTAYYLRVNRDVLDAEINPLSHYCHVGWKEGRDPHPLFDSSFYIEGDITESAVNPLIDFCDQGWINECNPHPLFDVSYYLSNNKDVDMSGINPLIHFCENGCHEFRNPHPLINAEYIITQNRHIADGNFLVRYIVDGAFWDIDPSIYFSPVFYKTEYNNIYSHNMNPLMHFVLFGLKQNCNPISTVNFSSFMTNGCYGCNICNLIDFIDARMNIEAFNIVKPHFGMIMHNPLVSIIAVNYNGSDDLPIFIQSVQNQQYRNFELIIVDNASSDNSVLIIEQAQEENDNITLIKSDRNLGFAEGNNSAIEKCNGDLFALVNVDTKLDENWLGELVMALIQDGDAAAVTSKTYFWGNFRDLVLFSEHEFSIDLNVLLSSLTYKKYFIRFGVQDDDICKSLNNQIVISLPLQDAPIDLEVFSSKRDQFIHYKLGSLEEQCFHSTCFVNNLSIDFSLNNLSYGFKIINNAGSYQKHDGPADRGIFEYDEGQYDQKCYVDFFCGVSVLLRRSVLTKRDIFVSEFFAYFEDSELSRWLRANRYKILYAPKSILQHKHSATTTSGSASWNFLVSRSIELYRYDGDYNKLRSILKHKRKKYKRLISNDLYNNVKRQDVKLLSRIKDSSSMVKIRKSVAIYNSFWSSKGGGESHALSFATALQDIYDVYLISETDFSIDELQEYFNLDLSNCRKLIEKDITREYTSLFNVFINSTYHSNLESIAKKSYYIVSFPQKEINKQITEEYHFLYNGEYTKRWSEKYWGKEHRGSIVYPLGMIAPLKKPIQESEKERVIISVGRFFPNGHTKNQDLIGEAFIELQKSTDKYNDWKLVLLGSFNSNNKDDNNYMNKINKIKKGYKIEVITNASNAILMEYYRKASIYVHASGLFKDPIKEPENIEHFGITPVEAIVCGCYPVVYDIGGPYETMSKLGIGSSFHDVKELSTVMGSAIDTLEENPTFCETISEQGIAFLTDNEPRRQIRKIISV